MIDRNSLWERDRHDKYEYESWHSTCVTDRNSQRERDNGRMRREEEKWDALNASVFLFCLCVAKMEEGYESRNAKSLNQGPTIYF